MKEDQAIVAEPASDDLESEAVLDKSPEVEVVEEAKEVRIILVAFIYPPPTRGDMPSLGFETGEIDGRIGATCLIRLRRSQRGRS